MGECGCSNFDCDVAVRVRDVVLCVRVYPGCEYCRAPVGVDILPMSVDEARTWGVRDVETVELGGGQIVARAFGVEELRAVLRRRDARAEVKAWGGDLDEWLADVGYEILRDAVNDEGEHRPAGAWWAPYAAGGRRRPALQPVPMLLVCPACGEQHIDRPDPAAGWTNPPHRSHLCHACGVVWRPADVPTVGVAELATAGAGDTWSAVQLRAALAGRAADRGAIARREELAPVLAELGGSDAPAGAIAVEEVSVSAGARDPELELGIDAGAAVATAGEVLNELGSAAAVLAAVEAERTAPTATMLQAIACATDNGGKLVRFPGGFWKREGGTGPTFGTSTIEGLVRRGLGTYTKWQKGRTGSFPIELAIAAPPNAGGMA